MPKLPTLIITSLACLGCVNGLGSENNKPRLTGANINTADNRFGPSLQNNLDRAIPSKGNSLEKTDYIVTKLDIAKAVFGPSPRDLSQHVSKPATPEQREAYIRKNKEELIIASFLGITFGNEKNSMAFIVENTNGEINAVQSTMVSTPLIPQYMEIDRGTKELMHEIYNSPKFNALKKQRMDWIGKTFGSEMIKSFIKFDEQQIKNFLKSDEITSDKTSIKEESPKISPPSPQICQNDIKKLSQEPGVQEEKKPLPSINKLSTNPLSNNPQRLDGRNTTVVEL